ncbi:uncharacterized protein LOC134819819 isoform X1 [Bolinopsis microptera]|uniref:uncharacterized protein LOC134819819 isoform X1 n=1 Tax=Bolinopsis microptera TaxID=2820187 RepID=UPI003079ACE7
MAVCSVCNKPNSTHSESLIQCGKCKFYVHKECYGIPSQFSTVEGWHCQRCTLGAGNERCQLCPFGEGALKKTDNGGWAHILCAQYIPEVIFGNNYSMEPINLAEVPGPRFQQVCYICDEKGDDMAKRQGACMQCNVQNCINCFHVTCGQKAGLLVAEDCENRRIVDYYGFCSRHVKHKASSSKFGEQSTDSSKEKLPAVDTLLQAQQLKDVTKILPSIGNAPKTLPFDNGTNFKPVQPKVQAQPMPFQGVHKQDKIIDSGILQTTEGDGYPAKREGDTINSSSTASATTSTNSTPSSVPKTRKPSSETDTADSEDLGSEPIVKTLQTLSYSTGEKTKLKISKQSAPSKGDGSDGGEQYNDLLDVFSKKSKKKKYKSPDSELSDYIPYNERKSRSLHKKGKRGKMKKDPLRIRSLKSKIKSPKYNHNSYMYKSPPKTPVKVQKSQLLNGDKGYSPTSIVSSMMEETRDRPVEDYKPCTGKPLITLDTFFDRFKEMGMQYILDKCQSEKSRETLKQLQELNQVNSYLANRIKAKSSKLEQLKNLNARLSVPYSKPLRALPEAIPLSKAATELLSTIHKPPEFRTDIIIAETFTDKEIIEKQSKKDPQVSSPEEPPRPTTIEEPEVVVKLPVPASMSALVPKPTEPNSSEKPEEAAASKDTETPTTDTPQIIIAGDPPMAYTYKDGALVGYPEALQSSLTYNKALEDQYNKVVEQHYKEKISAAYFEAQRRQYEGLLQHQMQSKMQASDYLTQAYLSDPFTASYYYAQQTGRQMPSLTPHFPSNPSLPAPSYSGLSSRPAVTRPG